jgi:hypothetical protein
MILKIKNDILLWMEAVLYISSCMWIRPLRTDGGLHFEQMLGVPSFLPVSLILYHWQIDIHIHTRISLHIHWQIF